MPPLKPWCALDEMKSRRFVHLAFLSAAALTSVPQSTWSDSSSSTSGESSSYSSSGASSADWDEFEAENAWRATVTQFGFVSMINAAEPFSRKKVTYKVGPERYSFARLEREYGSSGDASCKAAFRFHLPDLRRLFAAMHFPEQLDTGSETVPSEEAFLFMLKRLAYPATLATLAWPAGRSPGALSRQAAHAGCTCAICSGEFPPACVAGSSTRQYVTSMTHLITCGTRGLWRLGLHSFGISRRPFTGAANAPATRADATGCRCGTASDS